MGGGGRDVGRHLRHIGGPDEHNMLVAGCAALHLNQQLVLHLPSSSCGIMASCIAPAHDEGVWYIIMSRHMQVANMQCQGCIYITASASA